MLIFDKVSLLFTRPTSSSSSSSSSADPGRTTFAKACRRPLMYLSVERRVIVCNQRVQYANPIAKAEPLRDH